MSKPKRELVGTGQIDEVSVVDKAANKQKFLFLKSDGEEKSEHLIKLDEPITVTIKSDGTEKGTTIVVNDNKLKKIDSFSFYYNKPGDDNIDGRAVSCSYSRIVESDGGFKGVETYWLTKNKGDNVMFEDSLKKLSGDEAYEFVAKEILEDKNDEIQKAFDTISEYQEDFTDELKKAVLTIAEYAASAKPVEKQEDETNADTDKTKKKDDEKSETEKSADEENIEDKDGLAKNVEEILTSVKEVKEAVEKSKEAMKEVVSRLETVEKSTGARQSTDGTDVNKGDAEYPSLKAFITG